MYFVFYITNDVFTAEEKLQSAMLPVEVVPTPVQDKAYCGVCIRVDDVDCEKAKDTLDKMEYKILK